MWMGSCNYTFEENRKFEIPSCIWAIPEISLTYLGNSLRFPVLGEFSWFPSIWGIPQISPSLRNFQNLKNIPFFNSFGNLREISGIPQIPGNLGKSQMPRNLRNFFKSIIGVGSCICLRWRVGWGVKGVYLVSKRGGGIWNHTHLVSSIYTIQTGIQ